MRGFAKTVFQFQTGSIKSEAEPNRPPKIDMFQFQTGSIKSILPVRQLNGGLGFNSKLVRLKAQ